MIISTATGAGGESGRADHPPYEDVDVLNLTSAQLHDLYGVRLADFGFDARGEIVEALMDASDFPLDRDQLTRLLEQVEVPSPCFLGWQEGDTAAPRPFLTDGSKCCWSLFFERDEKVAIVARDHDEFQVTHREIPHADDKARPNGRPASVLRRRWSVLRRSGRPQPFRTPAARTSESGT